MPEKIRMEYPKMEAMAKTFSEGQKQLQDTSKTMKSLAQQMEQGAFQGDAGAAFADAIKSKLVPAIDKLGQKYQELQSDIKAAMAEMKQSDAESKGKFN